MGGGTPSFAPIEKISDLLEYIFANLNISGSAEITIEVNPQDTTVQYLTTLRSVGINRVSLGVQSLDNQVLRVMNRGHDSHQAKTSFDACRSVGFKNVSIDLTFGLPTQNMESFADTVERTLMWSPDHISAYMLDLKENSQIAQSIRRKELYLPDEDQVALMYDFMAHQCAQAGYIHYEISNFAKPGHESRHNLKYWNDVIYIGLGAGAHSMTGRLRYSNVEDLEQYINSVFKGRQPIGYMAELTPLVRFKDALIMGMRLTNGVNLTHIGHRYHVNAYDYIQSTIGDLLKFDLCKIDRKIAKLTPKGTLLSNQVFVRWL